MRKKTAVLFIFILLCLSFTGCRQTEYSLDSSDITSKYTTFSQASVTSHPTSEELIGTYSVDSDEDDTYDRVVKVTMYGEKLVMQHTVIGNSIVNLSDEDLNNIEVSYNPTTGEYNMLYSVENTKTSLEAFFWKDDDGKINIKMSRYYTEGESGIVNNLNVQGVKD